MFIAYYLSGEQKAYDATALLEDHAGVIWCGTALGVYQLDRAGEQRVFRFVDMGIAANENDPTVQALLEDRSGAVWVGTVLSAIYPTVTPNITPHNTACQISMLGRCSKIAKGTCGPARERVCVC